MNKSSFIAVGVILASILLFGCGEPPRPIDEIREVLRGVPTYSVVLDDMKEEGNLFKTYYHKYRIISEEGTREGYWQEVPKDYYRRYLPFLGMTIWVKKDGKDGSAIGPPGYEYVGDSRYGRWQTDTSGRSFWIFYGQYRLISDLLGPRRIYRDHYTTYTTNRSQNRPYYGPNKQYGTNGSLTKRQKPDFYSRRMSREKARKTSFSDRVNRRIGRSRPGVRREGRRGK